MKFIRPMSIAVMVLVTLMLASTAKADPVTFVATLSGAAERPNPVNSPATGFVTLTIDGTQLTLTGNFSGLTAPATAAHIHGLANANAAAGVLVDFGSVLPRAVSGSFSTTITLTAAQAANVNLANFHAGLLYFNIHNANNPGGEIRGQFTAIPEPATLLLMGTGLASFAAARRRRKTS
ncbi:MAG: CHRD domain-containing protein [Blastocatellia bacterium]